MVMADWLLTALVLLFVGGVVVLFGVAITGLGASVWSHLRRHEREGHDE